MNNDLDDLLYEHSKKINDAIELEKRKNDIKIEEIELFKEKFETLKKNIIIPKIKNITERIKKHNHRISAPEVNTMAENQHPNLSYSIIADHDSRKTFTIKITGNYEIQKVEINISFSNKATQEIYKKYDLGNVNDEVIEKNFFEGFKNVLKIIR